MQPIHRDDMPAELLAELGRQFPDQKIICVGDAQGELPPNVRAALDAVQRRFDESLVFGTCIDCGAAMPGYPPVDDEFPKGWQPAPGWRHYATINGDDFAGWQCPTCDKQGESHETALE